MFDTKFLFETMKLAEKGRGFVAPNPVVGAVLARRGKVIAKDWHRKYGEGHAERNLLEKLKRKILPSDVLYITLEPCCNFGKTPPCVDIILESGVKKVVVGLFDRNPEVAGKGVALLRKKGVEVVVLEEVSRWQSAVSSKITANSELRTANLEGILEELNWQNRFFFRWVKDKRSWVTLKIAQTLDGRITPDRGQQFWLTGNEAKEHVHRMRARYDAILVGAKTVIVDDPELNVRLGKSQNPNNKSKIISKAQVSKCKRMEFGYCDLEFPRPVLVVLDAALSIPLKSQVVRHGTILFKGRQYKKRLGKKKALQYEGVEIVEVDMDENGYLALHQVLDELAARWITSVYVEGGPSVWSSFLKYKLADELMVYMAPMFLGGGVETFENIRRNFQLEFREMEVLGEDVYWNGIVER